MDYLKSGFVLGYSVYFHIMMMCSCTVYWNEEYIYSYSYSYNLDQLDLPF